MKYLKSYNKLFESTSELTEFIDYLNHDLEEDGLQIRKGDVDEFLNFKYKNVKPYLSNKLIYNKSSPSIISDRYKEIRLLFNNSNVEVFDIYSFKDKITLSDIRRQVSAGNSGLNLYDVEPHVKRLLDYAKSLGYTDFQVRKITQMSRKSQDVTQSFTGKGRLPESAKRKILILQILIMK
jgi:hypothetical protein